MISPFRVVLIFVVLAIGGLLSLDKIELVLDAEQESTRVTVSFQIVKSTPQGTEQQATAVLENVLSQIRDVKKISSRSDHSGGYITLDFDGSTNLIIKRFEIQALLRQIKPFLPSSMSFPVVSQITGYNKRETIPIMVYSLSGDQNANVIADYAYQNIQKKLGVKKGIRRIEIAGGTEELINISFDKDKLIANGISTQEVASIINSNNATLPLGFAKFRDINILLPVQILPKIESISSLSNLELKPNIKIKDIADITITDSRVNQFVRVNGKNTVVVSFFADDATNPLELTEKIKQSIKVVERHLPNSYEIHLTHEQVKDLEEEIDHDNRRTIILISILTLFILLVYRDIRYLCILLTALIMNIAITALIVWLLGVKVQVFSIAGLSIAFGIMIDHGIIIIDYYRKYRNLKITISILFSSLAFILSLFAVFLLPKDQRGNIDEFAVIVTVSIVSSLIVNTWFTTNFFDLFFKVNKESKSLFHLGTRLSMKLVNCYTLLVLYIANKRKILYLSIIFAFGVPLFMLPSRWEGHDLYNNILGSDIYREDIGPIINKVIGGSFRLFKTYALNIDNSANNTETKLYVRCELPTGNSLFDMDHLIREIEAVLKKTSGIKRFTSQVYSGETALVEIEFNQKNSGTAFYLKSVLSKKVLSWSGADWDIYGIGKGFTNSSGVNLPDFRVRLTGYNYEKLLEQVRLLSLKLKENRRIQRVDEDSQENNKGRSREEYSMTINDRIALIAGLSKREILGNIAQFSAQGQGLSPILIDDHIYNVVLKDRASEKFQKWNIVHGNIFIENGTPVKLNTFAKLQLDKTSSSILKENREYIKYIGFKYYGSAESGAEFLKQTIDQSKKLLPIGYSISPEGFSWPEESGYNGFFLIILLILVCDYIICCILLEDLVLPLVLVSMIPISFIGIFMTFYCFENTFGAGGFASFILVNGLVLNAVILILTDLSLFLRVPAGNKPRLDEKILKSIIYRSKPIVLSIIASIFGMVPFLIEGQANPFWFSLAIGTTGGMLFSLLVIFIIYPAIIIKGIKARYNIKLFSKKYESQKLRNELT